MKIKLELFGASRDFSDDDHLEIEVQDKASVEDLRNEIINYIDKNFKGNENIIISNNITQKVVNELFLLSSTPETSELITFILVIILHIMTLM